MGTLLGIIRVGAYLMIVFDPFSYAWIGYY